MAALPASIGVLLYYGLDGAMRVSRFLRVHKRPGRGGSAARRDEVDLRAVEIRDLSLKALAIRLRLSSKNPGSRPGGSLCSLLRRLRDGGV